MTDADPTYDIEAEKAILGAAVFSDKAHEAFLELTDADFYDPAHAAIAAVLREMINRGVTVDAITLRAEMENRNKLHLLRTKGGSAYLMFLADNGRPASAPHYAQIIRTATAVRMAHAAGRDLADGTTDPQSAEYFEETIGKHRARLDAIPGPVGSADNDDSKDTVGAILREQDVETDWLIPGLIAREERAVIVAAEGTGKTVQLRQYALCFAAGLNPWNGQRVSDGLKVLFIDTENSRDQSRRAYRWIASRVQRPTAAPGWRDRVFHKVRNDGVDLLGRDQKWFRDLADRISPDVIILSPAYKMMRGDPKEDRDVLALLDVIDKVRVAHKSAVLIETHAGHGGNMGRTMRPFGSSVWLRWPEIGFGWQRDSNIDPMFQPKGPDYLEAVDWRGQREPRDWPDRIRRGGPGELPFVPSDEFWKPSVDLSYLIPESERST